MINSSQPDSLDSQPTLSSKAASLSALQHEPQEKGGHVAKASAVGQLDTLDRIDTAGGSSTSSDLGELVDGWQASEATEPLEGRYELKTRLGQGGMGEVWEALDRRLNRPVAIKRLRPELVCRRGAIQRFLKEAQAVARLNHYHIVQIHDFGYDQAGPYLVMELIAGESLADVLKRSGAVELPRAVEIASGLCEALEAAHRSGIVHRDIKPANILIGADDVAKLSDFGVARLEGTDFGQTQTGAILGTPDFMAPEQRGDATRADARSDLWSLAATIYQMVAGELPRIVVSDRIPEPLREFLLKALESVPEKRFQSAGEMRAALREVAEAIGRSARHESWVPGQCPKCRHRNLIEQRFCLQCGTSLLEKCLACGAEHPTGAKHCGKCGVDLAAALQERLDQLQRKREEVRLLCEKYEHPQALRLLNELTGLEHARLAETRQWAEATRTKVEAEWKRLEAEKVQLQTAAEKQAEHHGFGEAVRLLERIPEKLRTGRAKELLAAFRETQKEIEVLKSEIRKAVSGKLYEGLLPRVQRYLELKPEDPVAQKLEARLRRRLDVTESAVAAVDAVEIPGIAATPSIPVSRRPIRRLPSPVMWIGLAASIGLVVVVLAFVASSGSRSDSGREAFREQPNSGKTSSTSAATAAPAVRVEASKPATPPAEAMSNQTASKPSTPVPVSDVVVPATVNRDPDKYPAEPNEFSFAGNLPSNGYSCRDLTQRAARLKAYGGNDETERAVTDALDWLARHQRRDGSWSIDKYKQACKDATCTGPGIHSSDAGATALGLLPFLAAGHTYQGNGPYQQIVNRSVDRLLQHQEADGNLGSGGNGAASQQPMYSHGLAAIALCEAFGMSHDKKLRRAAQLAIKFIEAAQHPRTGGWRYRPGEEGDTSVLAWQFMALKSGEMAGLEVNPATFQGAQIWLKSVSSGDFGGQFAYTPGGGATPTMTAVGLLCNQYGGAWRGDPMLNEGMSILMKHLPDNGARSVYYWYYATQVIRNIRGSAWKTWNKAMQTALLGTQSKSGCAAGSWDPDSPTKDAWGDAGGRLMVTSLSALCLEIYYRYPPLYETTRSL